MTKVITGLFWQKHDKSRINVELDGRYAFGISSDLVVSLSIGKELSEQQIQSLLNSDQYTIAYANSLRLISYRSRTEKEVRDRLTKKGFSSDVINKTVERLQKSELISDAKFANEWVENRSAFRPRSHRFLEYELRNKGVEPDAIQQALNTALDDETLAYKAAKQYASRLQRNDQALFKSRLSGYLLRRGFNYENVKNAVKIVWDEID